MYAGKQLRKFFLCATEMKLSFGYICVTCVNLIEKIRSIMTIMSIIEQIELTVVQVIKGERLGLSCFFYAIYRFIVL